MTETKRLTVEMIDEWRDRLISADAWTPTGIAEIDLILAAAREAIVARSVKSLETDTKPDKVPNYGHYDKIAELCERLPKIADVLEMDQYGYEANVIREAATALREQQERLETAVKAARSFELHLIASRKELHEAQADNHVKNKNDRYYLRKSHRDQHEGLGALKSQLTETQAEIARLREALERSVIAIDDWLHDFAADQCSEESVAESRARLYEHGTLWYIATVQEANRAALGGKE